MAIAFILVTVLAVGCGNDSCPETHREHARPGWTLSTSGSRPFRPWTSRRGCVAEARVVQSAQLWLDEAAVRAVARWRYTPTLLEGIPVAAVMAVTVSFPLN